MAIISKEEVKAFLDIDANTYDNKIELLIPELEAFVKLYCNDEMIDEDGNDSYPAGIKKPISELIRFDLFYRAKGIGANSESLGDYSIVYDFRNDSGYPEKTLHLLNPFVKRRMPKVKFV